MHIGHFTNTYIPTVSGVVRQVSALREAHMEQGHSVSIFTQRVNGFSKSEAHIFCYPTMMFKLPMDFPIILPFSPSINNLLPSLKLDVLHAHHPFVLGRVAISKARELKIPMVFTFHTRYWEHSHFFPIQMPTVQQWAKAAIHLRLRQFLQSCPDIVVYTESLRDLVRQTYHYEGRIHVVPTGIDLSKFQQSLGEQMRQRLGWQDWKVVISIGRLSLEKNWLTLIEAVRLVMQTHERIRLVLIGDGPQRKFLEHHVHQSGMANRVEFLGKVEFAEIPSYLHAANVFGFASTTETIGRATMEAMAAGLPVVAVAAGGTSDLIVSGHEGLLTDNHSSSLAEGIRKVLDDTALSQKLGNAAKLKAQSFNVKIEAEKMLEVYYNAIEQFRRVSTRLR
jgi:1,2-diacylglycerol 3-alpha-glucosyltransferase